MAGGYSVLTARTSQVILEGIIAAIFIANVNGDDIGEYTITDIDSYTELHNTSKCVLLSADTDIDLDETSTENIYLDMVFGMLKAGSNSATTIYTTAALDVRTWFGVMVTTLYDGELRFTATKLVLAD